MDEPFVGVDAATEKAIIAIADGIEGKRQDRSGCAP